MKDPKIYTQLSQIEDGYKNYLLEKLMASCSVEIYWENGKGIDPQFQFYRSIYEELGKFNYSNKAVRRILKAFKKNFNDQEIDCSEDGVFFKKVNVIINHDNNDISEYLDFKNDTVFIKIHCQDQKYFRRNVDEYGKLILHELIHGYEDYNRIKYGKQSISDIFITTVRHLYDNYQLRSYLSKCKYLLNPQERNAYFSQLEADVKRLIKSKAYSLDNFNYDQFKKDLQKFSIWQKYFNLAVFIQSLNNYNDEERKTVQTEYNKLFKDNKSFSDIKTELERQWKKFDDKFNQLIPKILSQNLPIKETHRSISISESRMIGIIDEDDLEEVLHPKTYYY